MFGWSRKLFASIASLAFGFGSVAMEAAETAPAPAVLRLSQRNEPADLDPATATLPDEFFIIRALAEGLVVPAMDGGQPRPACAERWDISADELVYTFHLRSDVTWSNREPVTANDFVASYRRLLAPSTAAPKADLFFAVKNAQAFVTGRIADFSAVGFHAPDARTLVVTLERPTPNFLLYVASGPWIPINPRTVGKFGRHWTQPGNHVGNGPFRLSEWRAHQRIVVKKNPDYRAAGQMRLDEIQFVAFDNGETEERAYRAGQIDLTMAVPVSKLDTYARERPDELHRTPLAETHYLAFNTHRPPLNDPRVRRALALAIDRAKIVERVLLGGQQPAGRFLPPVLAESGGAPAPAWALRFDPGEARRLLAAAGFAEGKKFPRLELTGWARTSVLEAVQEMWRQELGIQVAISLREAKVHVDALRTGAYDIGFITQIPEVADPENMLADFVTGAPGNYPHWSNPAYDLLLASAARTRERVPRSELLAKAESHLIESCAIAPLYFNTKNWLMAPSVHGWEEDALWTRDYGHVYLSGK